MKEKVRSTEDAEKQWQVVDSAFEVIYQRQNVTLRYQTLFDVFHVLVISDFGKHIGEWLEQSFSRVAKKICYQMEQLNSDRVAVFNKEYAEYLNLLDKVQKIAIYYDSRFALPRKQPLSSLVGYNVIRETLLASTAVEAIVQDVLASLDNLRNDVYCDYLMIRNSVNNIVGKHDSDRSRSEANGDGRERRRLRQSSECKTGTLPRSIPEQARGKVCGQSRRLPREES